MIKAMTLFDNSVAPGVTDSGIPLVWSGGILYVAAVGTPDIQFRLNNGFFGIPDVFGGFSPVFPDLINSPVLFAVDLPPNTYTVAVYNSSVSNSVSTVAQLYVIPKV